MTFFGRGASAKRRTVHAGLLGTALAAVALTVGGCAGSPASAASSPADNSAATDRAFTVGMVPYHQAAIDMAQVELAQGKNPQVRVLAKAIMSAQQHEMAEFVQLAQQQYKVTLSAMRAGPVGQLMSLPISMDVSTMGAELQKAPDVDHAFLAMMIPHHAGAVMMADQEQKTGTSPTLKQLAGAIISSQSQQIGQMQAMLGAGA
jgi:uncharacterized protein (DUF305 family)